MTVQRIVVGIILACVGGYVLSLAMSPEKPDNRTILTRIHDECRRQFGPDQVAVQQCEARTAERLVDDMERRKMQRVYDATR